MDSLTPLKGVFITALKLGLTSFGGPIAHIAYFERVYVREKKWLDLQAFSALTALCQMLPGPTSSQVNFLIGFMRAGWAGALLSFIGFTLPSVLLIYAFAGIAPHMNGGVAETVLHGLKITAVAVVAQAVWGMSVRLCRGYWQAGAAFIATALILALPPGFLPQALALGIGAAAGRAFSRKEAAAPLSLPLNMPRAGRCAGLFLLLLIALPLLAVVSHDSLIRLMDIFYRSGALVFGGGHVALPLLRGALAPAGFVKDDVFLAGYGLAQALPGPLFSIAAYLGAMAAPAGQSLLWAFMATIAIFLPGLLLALVGAGLWQKLPRYADVRGVVTGLNATVVGILGAALYDPLWKTAILRPSDALTALAGFVLLEKFKLHPLLIVVLSIAGAVAFKA